MQNVNVHRLFYWFLDILCEMYCKVSILIFILLNATEFIPRSVSYIVYSAIGMRCVILRYINFLFCSILFYSYMYIWVYVLESSVSSKETIQQEISQLKGVVYLFCSGFLVG